MSSSKAEELIVKAEKCLKTSLLKWTPDEDSAIDYYKKASIILKNDKMYERANEIYDRLYQMHLKNDRLYFAAVALQDKSSVLKELNRHSEIPPIIQQAGKLLAQNGNQSAALQVFSKTAKSIEDILPAEAANLYLSAADAAENSENSHEVCGALGSAAKMFVRADLVTQALSVLNRQSGVLNASGNALGANQCSLSIILLHLYNGDRVAARKVCELTYDCEKGGAVSDLLQAFDAGDPEKAKSILTGSTFKGLENEFVKLTRKIKLPAGGGTINAAGGDDKVTALSVADEASSKPIVEEDDDMC